MRTDLTKAERQQYDIEEAIQILDRCLSKVVHEQVYAVSIHETMRGMRALINAQVYLSNTYGLEL